MQTDVGTGLLLFGLVAHYEKLAGTWYLQQPHTNTTHTVWKIGSRHAGLWYFVPCKCVNRGILTFLGHSKRRGSECSRTGVCQWNERGG